MKPRPHLVIHIGWAKTATTTLQKRLFPAISTTVGINYLGKLYPSESSTATDQALADYNSLQLDLLYGVYPDSIHTSDATFEIKTHSLHVISEELLTSSPFNIHARSGLRINPCDYAGRLRRYFKDFGNEVTVLATIRNQVDWVRSAFAQSFPLYHSDPNNNTLPKHITFSLAHPDLFSTRNYAQILDSYSCVFGSQNIRLLMYEDLRDSPETFSKCLGDVLRISPEEIQRIVSSFHDNQTKRGDEDASLVAQIPPKPRGFRVIAKPVNSRVMQRVRPLVEKLRSKWPYSKLFSMIDSHRTLRTISVPPITSEQAQRMREAYRDSNALLLKYSDIDESRLLRYGYL